MNEMKVEIQKRYIWANSWNRHGLNKEREVADSTATRNQTEVVLTFPAYLIAASKLFRSRGARVILSSMTPTNPWESGTFSYTPSIYNTYTEFVPLSFLHLLIHSISLPPSFSSPLLPPAFPPPNIPSNESHKKT